MRSKLKRKDCVLEAEIVVLERGNSKYWRALAALFMGSFVEFALLYVTQPLLPALTADFSLSPSIASLSVSLTTGAMALALLPLAAVFNRLQRKPTMLAAMRVAFGNCVRLQPQLRIALSLSGFAGHADGGVSRGGYGVCK